MKTSLTPLVSIIIPVYNRAGLVSRAIESVQKQTFTDWEVLLIDDASTDNTKEVIKAFSDEDARIRLIDNIHTKGPSGARNTGLDNARGRYIAYQDSDDEWVEYHLETMVRYLNRYPDKIDLMTADPLRKSESTGDVFHYDQLDLGSIPHTRIEDGYLIDADHLFDRQLRGRVITTQCLVGKADVMKRVRWDESLSAAVDIMHNLRLCTLTIGVCHIADYQAIYWAHDDNLTNVSGSHSPARMERVHTAFARYWSTVLTTMELSRAQMSFVKRNLAACYAWHLGYHTFEPQEKFVMAARCYGKAIRLRPMRLAFYKKYLQCRVRGWMTGIRNA